MTVPADCVGNFNRINTIPRVLHPGEKRRGRPLGMSGVARVPLVRLCIRRRGSKADSAVLRRPRSGAETDVPGEYNRMFALWKITRTEGPQVCSESRTRETIWAEVIPVGAQSVEEPLAFPSRLPGAPLG